MTFDATPSPTGKKAPHCRTCGAPMKGHSKGICSTGSPVRGAGSPPVSPQAQQGAASGAVAVRTIMPGSYGASRPSEVSVGNPTLMDRIGPKLEETDLYYKLASPGLYANGHASTHEGTPRLMHHPTLLDDELGPEHSLSQVGIGLRDYERHTPSTSRQPSIAIDPSRSLAAVTGSFSSWIAPPSPSRTSTSVYDALSPPSSTSCQTSLPLKDILRATGARPVVHVLDIEHKYVRLVTQAAAEGGVHVARISHHDSLDRFYLSATGEPPTVRMIFSTDAEAVERYRRTNEALVSKYERDVRCRLAANDRAFEELKEKQEKMEEELKASKRKRIGFCTILGAGMIGGLAVLFMMAYS